MSVIPTPPILAIECRHVAKPSLESTEAVRYLETATPSSSLGAGFNTLPTATSLNPGSAFAPSSRIFNPADDKPNSPVVRTSSPAFAPPLGVIAAPNPSIVQSITRSSASFVSPPTSLTFHSRAASAKPSARPVTSLSEVPLGRPREIRKESGATPFAAKSLTHDATAFRAACRYVIPFGTSVFPTSISDFTTNFSPLTGVTATSSPIAE